MTDTTFLMRGVGPYSYGRPTFHIGESATYWKPWSAPRNSKGLEMSLEEQNDLAARIFVDVTEAEGDTEGFFAGAVQGEKALSESGKEQGNACGEDSPDAESGCGESEKVLSNDLIDEDELGDERDAKKQYIPADIEVSCPNRMVEFIKAEKEGSFSDRLTSTRMANNLKLVFLWARPTINDKALRYWYEGFTITKRKAKRLMKAGAVVLTEEVERFEPATPEAIRKIAVSWMNMVEVLKDHAQDIKHLHLCFYGHEMHSHPDLIPALAKIKVEESVTISGNYDPAWVQLLENLMNVNVVAGRSCTHFLDRKLIRLRKQWVIARVIRHLNMIRAQGW